MTILMLAHSHTSSWVNSEGKMHMDKKKLVAAQAATSVVAECFSDANSELNACWVNSVGVLDDYRRTASRLHNAKDAIDKALQAIRLCDWPTHKEFE